MQKCLLEAGEMILVRSGVNTGDCAIVPDSLAGSYAAYDLILNFTSKVIPLFISTFLDTEVGRIQLNVLKDRSAQPHLNAEEVSSVLVPKPPIEIQRSLVAEIEAARQTRKQKLAQADELLSSLDGYLLDQLGLSAPEESDRTVFAISLSKLRSAKRIDTDYFHPERILAIREQEKRTELHSKYLIEFADFVRETVSAKTSERYTGLANVQSSTGELIESNDKEAEGQSFLFIENDVLFARLRPYLNKVYRAESNGVCSTEFHVIRIREEYKNRVLPDYLATILRSSLILAQTKHMMTGNTHPRLANEDVINLVVPIPELEIQERLVTEVQHRRIEARRLRQEAETEWEAAKTFFEQEVLGEEA